MAQRFTIAIPGPGGQDKNVGQAQDGGVAGLPVVTAPSSKSTMSFVPDNADSVEVLAPNDSRKGGIIFNTASTVLYLALSGDEASVDSFTYRLGQNGFIEIPFGYTGPVNGMWATDANDGGAMVTEFF